MKKIGILFVVMLQLFLTGGCQRAVVQGEDKATPPSANHTENLSEQVNAVHLFKGADGKRYDWHSYGMPYRVNCVNGVTSPLCRDPLCAHDDEECPFYDCSGGMADGEIFFYRRGWLTREDNGYRGTEELCTYHVMTGEHRVLASYSDSIVLAGVYENLLYYYVAEWETAGEELMCVYHLYRADGLTGEITSLSLDAGYQTVGGYTSSQDYPNLYTAFNDRLYWYTFTEDIETRMRLYSTDLEGKDLQELGKVRTLYSTVAEGYGYSIGIRIDLGEDEGEKHTSYALYRAIFPVGEPEMILENIGTTELILSRSYLYYLGNATVDSAAQTRDGKKLLTDCSLYRAKLDGSEPEVVCSLEGYSFLYQEFLDEIFLDVKTDEAGTDYIAMAFVLESESGAALSPDTLIVNTETGECVVSKTDLSANHPTVFEGTTFLG